MKSLLTFVLLIAAVSLANAQAPATTNFFAGNWEVLVKGTPQGDVKLPMSFEVVDGKIIGKVTNPETKEVATMTSVEIKGEELFAAFSAGGYDLTMVITKKDDDHFVGKLMDMIEVEGTRLK
ncbi:hypothetical protein [Emticicia sp. TH156]|uniref:hypothetical protein n=1 Tax=Emticicia sp. TH156 TaxID=2067454 RepID=UPI000C77E312|nr:hypothetical protein [Emticicia sp. TH156]PLK44302.1 hypothetical protein C0V77_10945 [Emticicia sp. TH156]